jgi:hypothetical protein
MKRHADRPVEELLVYTALEECCPDCGRVLPIYQVISRPVQCVERAVLLKRRDKRCGSECPGDRPIFFAPRDVRVVLPNRIYGLDVTLHVGERHMGDGVPLAQITRDLNARGTPLDQRHTGRVFRDFVALTALLQGDEDAVQARLRAQGGIVLMCDGVQFEDRSPVLYLAWDAISGTPLFGERKPFRGEADLVPLLERVRAMGVPVLGVVSDKEKGLVPAVQRVFPDVPYQFCHTHFLKNCAKPLQTDLSSLQASVRRRADAVREVSARLSRSSPPAPEAASAEERVAPAVDEMEAPAPPPEPLAVAAAAPEENPAQAAASPVLTEEHLAREVCELVRANSRVSGKAPLDPAELKRHERLEDIRTLVDDARKKTQDAPGGQRLAPARRAERGAQADLARDARGRTDRAAHRHPPRARPRAVQRPGPPGPAGQRGRGPGTLQRLPRSADGLCAPGRARRGDGRLHRRPGQESEPLRGPPVQVLR